MEAARDSIIAHRELGISFDVQPIGNAAKEIVLGGWADAGRECPHWDWEAIDREHRKNGGWSFAVWSENRLCALVAVEARRDHVWANYIEGDPGKDALLAGQRSAVALDLIIRYAELCGVGEIRIRPLNAKLVEWYQTVAAFKGYPSEEEAAYYALEL